MIDNKEKELIDIDGQIEVTKDKILDVNYEIQKVCEEINYVDEQIINLNNVLKAKEEIAKVSWVLNILV